jgi:hypothetical protein
VFLGMDWPYWCIVQLPFWRPQMVVRSVDFWSTMAWKISSPQVLMTLVKPRYPRWEGTHCHDMSRPKLLCLHFFFRRLVITCKRCSLRWGMGGSSPEGHPRHHRRWGKALRTSRMCGCHRWNKLGWNVGQHGQQGREKTRCRLMVRWSHGPVVRRTPRTYGLRLGHPEFSHGHKWGARKPFTDFHRPNLILSWYNPI